MEIDDAMTEEKKRIDWHGVVQALPMDVKEETSAKKLTTRYKFGLKTGWRIVARVRIQKSKDREPCVISRWSWPSKRQNKQQGATGTGVVSG